METAPRHQGSVPEPTAAGWRWIPDRRVHLWWDGERFAFRAVWNGSSQVVVPCPPPPSRGRVALLFGLAAFLLGLTFAFGTWGYDQLERNCRRDYPAEVDACIADHSFGVDMIDSIGLLVSIGLVVVGLVGIRRRRRARRDLAVAQSLATGEDLPDPPG